MPRNCSHVDSFFGCEGADAATRAMGAVLVLTGRAYARAPTAEPRGQVLVRNPPEVGRMLPPPDPCPT
jgi:hypothetical protein